MFGSNTGTLNVWMDEYTIIDDAFVHSNQMLIWKSTGSKGKNWFQGRKTINSDNKYFRIVFEGVIGKSYSEATIGKRKTINTESFKYFNF